MVVKITVHLEKIRIANARVAESGGIPIFATSSYLSSEENELEFLRKISEIMIIFLLPRGYSLSPLKNLLSEILAFKSKFFLKFSLKIIFKLIFFSSFLSNNKHANIS